jgi:hypothetical protein
MDYVVTFHGSETERPLRSPVPEVALELAEEAERNGRGQVAIKVPGGHAVSITQFALEYCRA